MDEFTSCPVCFEDYEESGDHVPRLLPCSHTLCNKCVRELKRGKRVTCPQDRQTHKTLNETNNFPQNNYILQQLSKQKAGYKKCKRHGNEINLFCKNESCQQEICSICMIKNHGRHDVVELTAIKELKIAEITKNIDRDIKRLTTCMNKLKTYRDEANEKFSDAIGHLDWSRNQLNF